MKNSIFSMAMFFAMVVLCAILFCFLQSVYGQKKSVTERECALTEGAEVIWDLRVYQWVCCISRGEYLEDCVPISDKAALPKTSTKPLPKKGSGAIIKSDELQNQTE
jgi:hypothetical protein